MSQLMIERVQRRGFLAALLSIPAAGYIPKSNIRIFWATKHWKEYFTIGDRPSGIEPYFRPVYRRRAATTLLR